MQTLAITGNRITQFPVKKTQMKLHLKASLAFALAIFSWGRSCTASLLRYVKIVFYILNFYS